MSDWLHVAFSRWPWITPLAAVLGALWRWWAGRTTRPNRPRYESAEDILFPRDGESPRPGRGIARWLSSPVRLALKEAGESALEEEMAGLRDDLRRTQGDNKRLRAELESLAGSSGGSTNTPGASRPPSKPPRPRLPKSAG